MSDYVLYHGGKCPDGFGSAWSAWTSLGDSAFFIPVNHGDPMPQIDHDSNVYIVDFAYPKDQLDHLRNELRCKVQVIDHHASAQKDLAGFEGAIFDMNHSASILTWNYFHPNDPAPSFLIYVEARDLWKLHQFPNDEEVNLAIMSYPQDFNVWNCFANDKALKELAEEGRHILRAQNANIERILEHTRMGTLGDVPVVYVNSSIFESDACNALLEKYPNIGVSLLWSIDAKGRTRVSLRSRQGENVDVSVIAKQYGGGGHPTASGFKSDQPIDKLVIPR